MSMEINDNLYDDMDRIDHGVIGEWVEMHFPYGTLPIYEGDNLDADNRFYLNIQFDGESPSFIIKMADREDGLRSNKDITMFSFTMPVELLQRISRIGRN